MNSIKKAASLIRGRLFYAVPLHQVNYGLNQKPGIWALGGRFH